MKFKKVVLILSLFLTTIPAFSNEILDKGFLAFDTRYLLTNLFNNGFGFGVSFEYPLTDYFTVKGSFQQATMPPTRDRGWINSVGLKADARLYPFAKGMKYLYLGYGVGTDYIATSESFSPAIYLSHCPQIGWKQSILDKTCVDLYFGYRMHIIQTNEYYNKIGMTSNGFEFGLYFQLDLNKILNFFKR